MGYEAAAAFAPEARTRPDGFSSAFAALLAAGRSLDGERYFAAQALAAAARQAFDAMFGAVDIVLAPSTQGEAPAGLEATGDPIFNRMWTLLGNPCVHVPLGAGRMRHAGRRDADRAAPGRRPHAGGRAPAGTARGMTPLNNRSIR